MAADNPLSGALDEIAVRAEVAALTAKTLRALWAFPLTRDVPRLLAAFRLLLGYHAAYATTEEYAAVLTALTGKGKADA